MLKKSYESLTLVPEALQEYYVERDGRAMLQVEGMVDSDRLKEFRDENIRLKQEFDKFKDVDPAKYAELKAKEKDLEDGKLLKKDGFDAAVQQRVAEAKAAAEKAVSEAKREAEEARASLERHRMSIAIRDAGKKYGLRSGAESDLEARGAMTLKLVDGKLVAHDTASGTPLYDADANPMTHEKWIEKLTKEAPHLFEASQGAGGTGGNSTSHLGSNPFSSKTFNLTEQGRLMKENPALAQRMKAAAVG
jgi:hypothetical protein